VEAMKKRRFIEEQVIGILKHDEFGVKTADLCREHEISATALYSWKQKFDGMEVTEAQGLKALGDENRCLKLLGGAESEWRSSEGRDPKNGWSLPFQEETLRSSRWSTDRSTSSSLEVMRSLK
jgi:putative transposase